MNDGFLGQIHGYARIEDGLPSVAPLFLRPAHVAQDDDAVLDGWLASLTPIEFERILDSLARSDFAASAAAS